MSFHGVRGNVRVTFAKRSRRIAFDVACVRIPRTQCEHNANAEEDGIRKDKERKYIYYPFFYLSIPLCVRMFASSRAPRAFQAVLCVYIRARPRGTKEDRPAGQADGRWTSRGSISADCCPDLATAAPQRLKGSFPRHRLIVYQSPAMAIGRRKRPTTRETLDPLRQ